MGFQETSSRSILADLIAIPSVVGTSNSALVDLVGSFAGIHSVEFAEVPGPHEGRSNMLLTICPRHTAGTILSAHLDVVPAAEPGWLGDPFRMRAVGSRLIGRGATDMKGFAAVVLAMLPKLVQLELKKPIHVCFSYDEEAGCRGVPHLINKLPKLIDHQPTACIVGEPTGLRPVLSHKGKTAARIIRKGLTGHSSRPELGINAVHGLVETAQRVVNFSERLKKEGPFADEFEPPYSTVQIGTIKGGSAVNVIPEIAEMEIEIRAIPNLEPRKILDELISIIREENLDIEIISSYPGFSLSGAHPLAELLVELSGGQVQKAVSFGTEAGVYQAAGIPSIVFGPGDVDRAHKPEEFITIEELDTCEAMLNRLLRRLGHFGIQ